MKFIDVKRILVITGGRIGDQLMTTPLFRSLRKTFPKSFITGCAGLPALNILKNNPSFDELLLADKKIISGIAMRAPYDMVIDLCSMPDTGYLSLASGARYRIGVLRSGLPAVPKQFYTDLVPSGKMADSFVDSCLIMSKKFGFKSAGRQTEFCLTADELHEGKKNFHCLGFKAGEPVVGIFPCGSHRKILWPARNFGYLADLIIDRLGAKVIFFYDPREKNQAKAAISAACGKCAKLVVSDVRRMAAVLKHVNYVIAGDRGPMHMAAALGVPVAGIFGPYGEQVFFPYPCRKNIAIAKSLPCRPCFKGYKHCKYGIACLRRLSVEEVFAKVKGAL